MAKMLKEREEVWMCYRLLWLARQGRGLDCTWWWSGVAWMHRGTAKGGGRHAKGYRGLCCHGLWWKRHDKGREWVHGLLMKRRRRRKAPAEIAEMEMTSHGRRGCTGDVYGKEGEEQVGETWPKGHTVGGRAPWVAHDATWEIIAEAEEGSDAARGGS